jgi:hypothetical protein
MWKTSSSAAWLISGQVPVEALVDLLQVEPRGRERHDHREQPAQADQDEERKTQLAVEGARHGFYPANRSLNL